MKISRPLALIPTGSPDFYVREFWEGVLADDAGMSSLDDGQPQQASPKTGVPKA